MTVSEPMKPSARSVSAAVSPASEAPTITIRPRCMRPDRAPLPCPLPRPLPRPLLCPLLCPLRCMRLLHLFPMLSLPIVLPMSAAHGLWRLHDDRLDGTRRGGAQYVL